VTIAAAPLKVETGEDLRPVMLQVGGDLGLGEIRMSEFNGC
jgi:hypothetical protein